MIQMPRRSVTRFFIPLIDVLILLFCIYLLMPMVAPPDAAAGAGTQAADRARPPDAAPEPAKQETPAEVRDRRRREVAALEQKLAIRVLEIDADTGRLYCYDPERVEIAREPDARALIERQRRQATGRERYYLFLFPRRVTGYPEERQIRQYDRWFDGVAHGFDNPRRALPD
jgi:hypothetical protein